MNLTNDTYLRIVNAKLYIDENYHEQLDLEEVSKKAFISKFHFHRLFRKVYRQTPHQYITKKRIDKAKDLLAENKPVTEVCNEVGFESIGSFGTLFRKMTGDSPLSYRKKIFVKKPIWIPSCYSRHLIVPLHRS